MSPNIEAVLTPDEDAPVFDHAALGILQRLGGDKLLHAMIDVFAVEAPSRLSAARKGAESLDSEAARRALHALKSSSAQLGAALMHRLCAEGERVAAQGASPRLSQIIAALDAAYDAASERLEGVKSQGLPVEAP